MLGWPEAATLASPERGVECIPPITHRQPLRSSELSVVSLRRHYVHDDKDKGGKRRDERKNQANSIRTRR